jgi:hypothetical protein
MTLAAGTKLGPYEIQSPLGAGGRGEVQRFTRRDPERSEGGSHGPKFPAERGIFC